MNQPLISVIVPCYNQAQYLDECLQSVLDQTFSNWECIIVNDGSPDDTEEVVLKWIEKDSRFIYLKKENGGVSRARNFGIERARGEWILPLDGDDKIGNQYLELAEKEFCNNYTIIYCKAQFFGTINSYWDLSQYSYEKILQSNFIFCSTFYNKKSWKKVNGYDEKLIYGLEDWEFWISILNKNSKALILDYLGFYYRRKENSRDLEYNKNKKNIFFTENYIYQKHYDKISKTLPSYYNLSQKNRKLEKQILILLKDNERLLNLVNEPISTKIKRKFLK
jgi:glycosyltransferase involved in cell wall biosynthesis